MSILAALRYLAVIASLIGAGAAHAQAPEDGTPPALIADSIRYDPVGDRLIATGNVQVFFDGRVLNATRVIYANKGGQISVEGPLTITQDGGATLMAQSADLDPQLEAGLLYGARLVLAENFQFAANRAQRVNGRYTTLEKSVASACKICNRTDTPVWLIRADRVIHDAEARVVHFEGARFEFLGLPIAYFPYFRTPDPSQTRSSGFLSPQFKNSDIFGFGLRIPYFHVIDDHRDFTLTPFLTTTGANLLEGEYRQRFSNGELDISGAIAKDDNPNLPRLRAFLDASTEFRLKRNWVVGSDLNWASDNALLNEYGYSSADRLTSQAYLNRQTPNSRFDAELVGFQSLRDGEDDRTLPYVLPRLSFETYWDEPISGGRVDFRADAQVLGRQVGRDVFSAGLGASWIKSHVFSQGLVGKVETGLDNRVYITQDDPAFPSSAVFISRPMAMAELSWPLSRTTDTALQIIEPKVQIVYSDVFGDQADIPNEGSLQLEFDAANLFSANRFPGLDRGETGLRANVGLNLAQISRNGWNYSATFGQVFRADASSDFPTATGLNDRSSNYVAATNVEFPPYFSLANQTLLSTKFAFERNDIQLALDLDRFEFDASYVYLAPDPNSGATSRRQELRFDGRYQALPNWAVDWSWRRDLAVDDDVEASAGIEYGNECIRSRFSVSRRFTNSNSLPSSTEFGFSVSLAGLGGSTKKWPAHACTAL